MSSRDTNNKLAMFRKKIQGNVNNCRPTHTRDKWPESDLPQWISGKGRGVMIMVVLQQVTLN